MSFTPSRQQAAAILTIIDWFRNRTHLQQVFRGLIETTWGYAMTCHKAQGSQHGAVIVFDDNWVAPPRIALLALYRNHAVGMPGDRRMIRRKATMTAHASSEEAVP
jgi:UvrD-like helicase C-terminal domain